LSDEHNFVLKHVHCILLTAVRCTIAHTMNVMAMSRNTSVTTNDTKNYNKTRRHV